MNDEHDVLRVDREHAWFLGVCAGLGQYLSIPAWVVRLLMIVATFTWALTLLAYPLLYMVMQRRATTPTRTYRTRTLAKDRAHRKISGVCAGFGRYLNVDAVWIRLGLLGSLFLGPFALIGYPLAALLMDADDEALEWDDGMGTAPSNPSPEPPRASVQGLDIKAIEQKLKRVQGRLQQLETTVTSREFELRQRFKEL